MSTAGTIFDERVFSLSASSAGKKTYNFQVKNDGFILAIDYISGSSNILLIVNDVMPGDMSDLEIDRITIQPSEINGVKRFAYIAGRQASVTIVYESAAELIFSTRDVSAETIIAFNDTSTELLQENNKLLQSLISAVESNEHTNQKVLNHLRKITEINDDEGEEY